MPEDREKRKELSKWIIGIVSACLLVYLAIRHIASITNAFVSAVQVVMPLIVGITFSLFLNVPMSFIESKLLVKYRFKGKRTLAIIMTLAFVFGILVGVAFLVIPEFVEAIRLIVQIIGNAIEGLAELKGNEAFMGTQMGTAFASLNVDWIGLSEQLESWLTAQSLDIVNRAVGAAGSFIGIAVNGIIGLTFSIYILAKKETIKQQLARFIHVWLPHRFGAALIHVASVCGNTFKLFVAGQTTEAIILGSLCMLGMLVLHIPYAPMVGALVGVTALIPIVGAWIGAIVGTVMILTVDPVKAVVFLLFLLVLQQVEGNAIYPKVVGAKINLPSMLVLVAITIGGNIAGPVGMLLGVPTFSALYALLNEATDYREMMQTRTTADGNPSTV